MVAIVPRTDETTYGPVLLFFNCVIIVGLRATKTCHRPVSRSRALLFSHCALRVENFSSSKEDNFSVSLRCLHAGSEIRCLLTFHWEEKLNDPCSKMKSATEDRVKMFPQSVLTSFVPALGEVYAFFIFRALPKFRG